jgi:hypothetical protein
MDKRTFLKISALAGAGAMVNKIGIASAGNKQVGMDGTAQRMSSPDYNQGLVRQDLYAGAYPGNWVGRFIWDKGEAKPHHYHLMLRKTFDLTVPAIKALLHIAVADKYMLYLNGMYVGRGPCRSVGPKWISYDTWDVAALLKPCNNTIAVHAYYYGFGIYNTPCHPFAHLNRAGLFVQLEAGLAGGSSMVIGSDGTWSVRVASGFRRDVRIGNYQIPAEVYEAGRDPEDWMKAEYDHSSWDRAVQLPDADWEYLEPRVTPLLRERELFPVKLAVVGEVDPPDATQIKDTDVAQRLNAEKHGPLVRCKAEKASGLTHANAGAIFQSSGGCDPFVILDFGQPYLGVPRLVFEAAKGTVIEISYAPTNLVDGRIPFIASAPAGDRYVARDGVQVWQPFDLKMATRMMQVVFRSGGAPVHVHSVSWISQEYPVRLRGSFACSNITLTRLWQAVINTVYLHLEDTYSLDAVRERQPYLHWGEMEQSHLAYYASYGDIATTELCFQHTKRCQLPSGMLAWWTGYYTSWAPTYMTFYAQAVLNRHRYFAKPGFLQEQYPVLVRLEQYWQANTNANSGLIDSHWPREIVWFDWPTYYKWEEMNHGEKTREYFFADALRYKALEDMSVIAAKLGKHEESVLWKDRAGRILELIRSQYWDPKTQLYADFLADGKRAPAFSELDNGMALLLGIATPEQTATIVRELTRQQSGLIPVYPEYIYYVVEGLIKCGEVEYSYRYLADRYTPMVEASDFPTIWESWDGFMDYGGSTIHGGSTGAAWTLTTHALGLTPLSDGFKQIRIAPECGGLTWAEGTFPSAAGDVFVSWKRQENGFYLEAVLPEEVTGELILPLSGQGPFKVVHNGKLRKVPPIGKKADGIETGQLTVTLHVPQGRHHVQLIATDIL